MTKQPLVVHHLVVHHRKRFFFRLADLRRRPGPLPERLDRGVDGVVAGAAVSGIFVSRPRSLPAEGGLAERDVRKVSQVRHVRHRPQLQVGEERMGTSEVPEEVRFLHNYTFTLLHYLT